MPTDILLARVFLFCFGMFVAACAFKSGAGWKLLTAEEQRLHLMEKERTDATFFFMFTMALIAAVFLPAS